jgi:hypothetical protein
MFVREADFNPLNDPVNIGLSVSMVYKKKKFYKILEKWCIDRIESPSFTLAEDIDVGMN